MLFKTDKQCYDVLIVSEITGTSHSFMEYHAMLRGVFQT